MSMSSTSADSPLIAASSPECGSSTNDESVHTVDGCIVGGIVAMTSPVAPLKT